MPFTYGELCYLINVYIIFIFLYFLIFFYFFSFSLCSSFPFYISHFHYRPLHFVSPEISLISIFVPLSFFCYYILSHLIQLQSRIIYFIRRNLLPSHSNMHCYQWLPTPPTHSLQSFHIFPLSVFVMFLDTMVTSLSFVFHNFCIN